jgi:predicted secreted protein
MADQLLVPSYKNSGCPGGSNERAYRVLINDLSLAMKLNRPEEIFVVIGLTHVTRREFCFDDKGNYYIHLNAFEPDRNKMPAHHTLWETFVKHFNFDHGHFTFDMMMVLGIQNFLRINKIPYLITASLPIEFHLQQSVVSSTLLDQIVKNRYYVKPSFFDLTKSNNYKQGPLLHPLEEGHAAWAAHLLNYINENNLLDNSDL